MSAPEGAEGLLFATRAFARSFSTAAKVVASDTAVWAVDLATRLSASRSSGEGANDALLIALGRGEIADA